MIKVKIQYSSYEKGEFTEENGYSLDEIIELINKNTELIHFKHSYQINKQGIRFYFQDGENYLKAEHFGKNAFHISYCNDPDNKLYQGNFYLNKFLKVIDLFYNQKHNELVEIIPRTSEHEKKLIKTFVAENFVYSKKRVGLFNTIFWSIFPLFFLLSFLFNTSESKILLLVLGSLASIPFVFIIRLYNNYQKFSNINAIKISAGINEIIIWENFIEFKFNKMDIDDLLIVDPNIRFAHRGTPFDSFGYTKIKLKNGKNFIIPSNVIDMIEIQYKVWNIPHRVEKKFYPYIDL